MWERENDWLGILNLFITVLSRPRIPGIGRIVPKEQSLRRIKVGTESASPKGGYFLSEPYAQLKTSRKRRSHVFFAVEMTLLAPPTFMCDVVDLDFVVEDPATNSEQFCCILLDPVAHLQGLDNYVPFQVVQLDSGRRDL